jgi:amyloid beta precursor protein binding protein 1
MNEHALPPTAPTLPDMHSSTASYLELQGLYRAQYHQDLQEFDENLQSVLSKVGLPSDAIPRSEIEDFVKNTNGVALIKGTSIASRQKSGGGLKSVFGKLDAVYPGHR